MDKYLHNILFIRYACHIKGKSYIVHFQDTRRMMSLSMKEDGSKSNLLNRNPISCKLSVLKHFTLKENSYFMETVESRAKFTKSNSFQS